MKVIANNLPQKCNLQEQLNNLTAEDIGALPLLTVSNIELTNETTLEELAVLLINRPEACFTLSIWSNQNTYSQLWNDINSKIGTSYAFGSLIISRKSSVLYFDFAIYNTAEVYRWAYTTINNKGMSAAQKIQSTTGDTAENTITFTNSDSTNPSDWTEIDALSSGEKHSSLLNKISTMFKNVRYLYKMLGTTDISSLGNGTVTGGLSELNTNLDDHIFAETVVIGNGGYGWRASNSIHFNKKPTTCVITKLSIFGDSSIDLTQYVNNPNHQNSGILPICYKNSVHIRFSGEELIEQIPVGTVLVVEGEISYD